MSRSHAGLALRNTSSQPTTEAAATQLASYVMTAPQLLTQLPKASRQQLTSAPVLKLIMAALQQFTLVTDQPLHDDSAAASCSITTGPSSHSINQPSLSAQGSREQAGVDGDWGSEAAMCALSNLAALLAGERVTKAAQV